jgi:hypothetical protein
MAKKLYAEDVNYWKSSATQSDTWIAKAKKEIEHPAVGGKVIGEAFGSFDGSAAYVIQFKIGEDNFRVMWPVMESRAKDESAARRQAATFLYHDVKAKCMVAKVLGARKAFVGDLLLPDGRTITEAASPETFGNLPRLLAPPRSNITVSVEGEIVD